MKIIKVTKHMLVCSDEEKNDNQDRLMRGMIILLWKRMNFHCQQVKRICLLRT